MYNCMKLAVEIAGPFTRNGNRHEYTITLVEFYSKWPEVCFASVGTSQTVINFLICYVQHRGLPG